MVFSDSLALCNNLAAASKRGRTQA